MANFFSDNKDLQFHLQHPLMRKIVELKERGFAEKDLYDYAPQDTRFRKILASYLSDRFLFFMRGVGTRMSLSVCSAVMISFKEGK